jgi:hypothetical protein
MNKKQNSPALNTPILAFTVHINQGTEACGRSQQKMEVGIMERACLISLQKKGRLYIYIHLLPDKAHPKFSNENTKGSSSMKSNDTITKLLT